MQPYTIVEAQVKELRTRIDEPLRLIADFAAQEEAQEKTIRREEIKAFFYHNAASLGDLADMMFASHAFYESKWENKPTSVKTYQDAILAKLQQAAGDTAFVGYDKSLEPQLQSRRQADLMASSAWAITQWVAQRSPAQLQWGRP